MAAKPPDARATAPVTASVLGKTFRGGKKRAATVETLLETLVALGQARKDKSRYFIA